jgi:hypothetical protein
MKVRILITTMLFAALVTPAAAQYRQMDVTIFGMD